MLRMDFIDATQLESSAATPVAPSGLYSSSVNKGERAARSSGAQGFFPFFIAETFGQQRFIEVRFPRPRILREGISLSDSFHSSFEPVFEFFLGMAGK